MHPRFREPAQNKGTHYCMLRTAKAEKQNAWRLSEKEDKMKSSLSMAA
jgi:hypothetical protein